jgi:hypothetical protein
MRNLVMVDRQYDTNYKEVNYLKKIFFIFFIVPSILHIFANNLTLIYWNNVGISVFVSCSVFLLFGIKRKSIFNGEAKFIPFILFVTISLILNHSNIAPAIKYIAYVFMYCFIFKQHLSELFFYKLFVRVMVALFIVMFFVYITCIYTKIYMHFPVDHMTLPSNLNIVERQDFIFYFPFYLLVYPISHSHTMSTFPRFCGFSAEPTLYAAVILPCVFIAKEMKMKRSYWILVFALLLTRSYGAIFIFFICYLYSFMSNISKGNKDSFFFHFILIALVTSLLLSYYFQVNDSHRASNYSHLITLSNGFLAQNFTWFTGIDMSNFDQRFLGSFLTLYFHFGFMTLLAYFFILICFVNGNINNDKKQFLIAACCITFKTGEPLSLLFLFYLNYLNVKDKKYYISETKSSTKELSTKLQ